MGGLQQLLLKAAVACMCCCLMLSSVVIADEASKTLMRPTEGDGDAADVVDVAPAALSLVQTGLETKGPAPQGADNRIDMKWQIDTEPMDDEDGWTLLLFDDFEDGGTTWSNGHITACGGVTLLGGYASTIGPQGEVYAHVTDLPPHEHIRIRFELFFVDDWENEFFYMKVDDKAVYSRTCQACGRKGRNFCGNHRYQDTLGQRVDVLAPHKRDILRITFGSSSSGQSSVKSWGISNLEVYFSNKCTSTPGTTSSPGGAAPSGPMYQSTSMMFSPSTNNQGVGASGCGATYGNAQQGSKEPIKTYTPPPSGAVGGAGQSRDWPGTHCRWLRDIGMRDDGLYWINPTGHGSEDAYQAWCDMNTDGGGWTLFTSYKHEAGTNPAKVNAIPQHPMTGFGHKSLKEMGFEKDQWYELRFYCETDLHGRKVHFKTINENILRSAWEWDQTLFVAEDWRNGWKPLPGHSGHLPGSTNAVFSQKYGGFFEFPFYQSGSYHWAIRGLGNRWECDDYSQNAGRTIHNVWVR
eukprot:GFYU01003654.1.p1 GENE.GFYU01003654.1~~GFYU01003654.1.p1  ORF type:complete len:530 (+),score=128.98 GFYU01003654.1:25-1590(+)